jgi:ribokinase
VDILPKVGETVFGKTFQKSFGGKGANQSVQCARLGVKCSMIGVVGRDSYGDEYLVQLANENVVIGDLRRSDDLGTGTASIQVDERGQNSIIIVQGSNLDFTAQHVLAIESSIEHANIVLCQNEVPIEVTKETLLLCRKHSVTSVLNPAPASASVLELIPLCDIFCPNETELASLTGLPTETDEEIKVAADYLLRLGCKIVVVTLGVRGALLVQPDRSHHFPTVLQVSAIDTVGAGDSFIGKLELHFSVA